MFRLRISFRDVVAVVVVFILFAARSAGAQVGAPTIGLTADVANSKVIIGGATQVNSQVRNTAPTGFDPLNFDLRFEFPIGSSTVVLGQTRPADGGLGFNSYAAIFDSDPPNMPGTPPDENEPGNYTITVRVDALGATNTPRTVDLPIEVAAHARPFWAVVLDGILQPPSPVEPTFAPEQFGATGGGEQFAAAAGFLFNNENSPTAALDLDAFSESGSPQITSNFATFTGLAANGDPTLGKPFAIFLDRSTPGVFTKTFFFGFSDENLPGASDPGSVLRSFDVTFTVVPTPAAVGAGLITLGLMALRQPAPRVGPAPPDRACH